MNAVAVFRQLFEASSSAYTYLLADRSGGQAVLIDPVQGQEQLYLSLLQEEGLALRLLLETHLHADHVTGGAALREATGARIGIAALAGTPCADLQLAGGDVLVFGDETLRVLATPGHTPGCLSFLWRDRLFSGDALLIGGCGRTDLPGGDAGQLYDSILREIWPLPDETLVYPAHDFLHRRVSCVIQERETNVRLAGRSRDEFIAMMAEAGLAPPRRARHNLLFNRQCGGAIAHAA